MNVRSTENNVLIEPKSEFNNDVSVEELVSSIKNFFIQEDTRTISKRSRENRIKTCKELNIEYLGDLADIHLKKRISKMNLKRSQNESE